MLRRQFGVSGRFATVVALTLAVLLLPTPEGLPLAGKRALAALVFAGGVFAVQPVSLPFASLMVSVALVVFGVADSSQAFEVLSRPIIILILGSLFIAEALRKHGVTRRLALFSVVSSGGDVGKILLGMMAIAALLSMWMENTATAAVLIPVALTISNQIPDRERAREVTVLLVLGIAYSASLGGMVTVTGSASNAVASGFLSEIQPWGFLDWIKYGLPPFVLIFPLTWWALRRFVPVSTERMDISLAREELENLGAARSAEWEVIAVLNVTALLWVIGTYLEPYLGFPATALSPAVVAMISVAYMSLRGLIVWEDVKGVSWGMFFIIGSGLALGDALVRSGATAWLTELVSPVIRGVPFLFALMFLVFMSALLTNVMNNTTVTAVFVPILISITRGDPSFSSVQLVLPLTLATTFGYALPSASGRMALISETGIVGRGDMVKYGMILTVLSSVVLVLVFYLLSVMGMI
jgi:sodium-dependent dicarboxylate transporter 2/3/5